MTVATLLLALTATNALAATVFAGPDPGSDAGQVNDPVGVAVDQSVGDPTSGDVYIADQNNFRVDVFDSNGLFKYAFGFGVLNGAKELQTCTTVCGAGLEQGGGTSGPGASRPESVAVDSVSHDIYIYDGRYDRVEKYAPEGRFLLMFGREVNKTAIAESATRGSEENICPAPGHPNDTCGAASRGTGEGQFASESRPPIALSASGNVWVGDVNRLEEFDEGGKFLSEIKLPGFGEIGALAIDTDPTSPSFDDFYTITPGKVSKLGPLGEALQTLDSSAPYGNPSALALDPANGDLFVADWPSGAANEGKATVLSYDALGTPTEAYGKGEVLGGPTGNALAFGDIAQRLYAVSSTSVPSNTAVEYIVPPLPGPLVESGSTTASPLRKTTATLTAEVNPEGESTEYEFEYVDQASFESEGGFAGPKTQRTPATPLGASDLVFHQASVSVSGLVPATTYRFRVIASNAKGVVDGERNEAGEELVRTFTTLPPAEIDSTSVAEVSAGSATLQAEVNPLGDATFYRFEYLTEAAYLQNEAAGEPAFTGASQAPLSSAPLGSGEADVAVSQHVRGLQPDTAYRYRVLAFNHCNPVQTGEQCSAAGGVFAFTTQGSAVAPTLPDGRVWELVSPPEKHAALITPIGPGGIVEAAANGDAITYGTFAPIEAEPQGYTSVSQVLSGRGTGGWSSRDIDVAQGQAIGLNLTVYNEYPFFSEDLSFDLLQPFGGFDASLSPAASEQTPYRRTNFLGGDVDRPCAEACFQPLVTAAEGLANVPEGTAFGEEGRCPSGGVVCGPKFLSATADLNHVVLESSAALTPEAPSLKIGVNLFEWSAGRPPSEALQFVSILPNGKAAGDAQLGAGSEKFGNARGAISADGSRVVFSEIEKHLYLRDLAKRETVQLDAVQGGAGGSVPGPVFQIASNDGSRIFFTDAQQLTPDAGGNGADLYECQIAEVAAKLQCVLSDLNVSPSGEAASVVGGVLAISADGSSVYFVSNAVLTRSPNQRGETAQLGNCTKGSGTCNLYLRDSGQTRFIAALSGADAGDLEASAPQRLTARLSPNGRWFAFMSQRPLTGYDNRDVVSGVRDEEVFVYDAQDERLRCASCNPTGARPHGIEDGPNSIIDGNKVWVTYTGSSSEGWLAANIPGWTPTGGFTSRYQSRYLSDSGRLFFNSSDALVPQDTNGTEDVYEYEPAGVGSCTASSLTYSRASEGCVDLVSSGTSNEESAFLDASESGDDVFFLTSAQLSGKDTDTAPDVYDARVDGSEAQPPPPSVCEGDACQSLLQPPDDLTPGSLTFSGPGNVVGEVKPAPAAKKKTAAGLRAEKLAKALKSCKKERSKSRRARCEKTARKRYGAKASAKRAGNERRAGR